MIGVIPQTLLEREVGYLQADELIVTQTLRERKQIMDDRAEAFVALPGGFGTLEELLEIITLRQLGYHNKPIVILNVAGYFDALLSQFEAMFELGFAHPRYRDMYTVVPTVDEVIACLASNGRGEA
ncbi:MAG TPA: TIGR00730 family Rossman fold protein [Roseiflexaceae bacterium]|nr:TIGR00730 family Rossman fold protein [Roseiflexaceae bacterium]